MKENKKIVTALDIGSSKILAVVAEIYKDGTFRVLGQGRTESQGVLDGNVTSPEELQPQVKNALVEAFGIAGKCPAPKLARIFPENPWKGKIQARKCLCAGAR